MQTRESKLGELCAALVKALMEGSPWWNYLHLIGDAQELLGSPASKTPLETLHLPTMIFNCLMRSGITTVERLREMEPHQILMVRGLGEKSLAIIATALELENK